MTRLMESVLIASILLLGVFGILAVAEGALKYQDTVMQESH